MRAPPGMNEEIGRQINRLQMSQQGACAAVPANFAEDPSTFVTAVEAELCCWDAYLERLQVKAAAAGSARVQAEAAISELRRHTRFCGACGACQRERLARWREQLAAATTLARMSESTGASTSTSHGDSAMAPTSSR